ncbi:MAG: thiamine-phosphate kinase, partial [Gemmatimonadetes bacterium]
SAAARAAFARPRPRVDEARWLAGVAQLHALIDLSDGLVGDAGHVAAASGAQLHLEAGRVPVHDGAAGARGLDLALSGGEDYELLAVVPAGALDRHVEAFGARFDLPLTRVGRVEAGPAGVWVDGRPWKGGFDHFDTGREER